MKSNLCESDRLVAFLEGALSDQDLSELTVHLDECPDCGRQLEELAANPNRWQEARSLLASTANREVSTNPDFKIKKRLPFTIQQVVDMLDPTDDPKSMGRLGSYEVTGVVGSGAMGVVLKAVDPTLDRIVALKVMNPTLAACGTARFRFAREAKAAAGVLHPNVIAIHGVSTERELPYLVMPYIAGTSLQQRMNRQGPLELPELLRIGSQIAAGLAAAHQKGLIHRDIKPSNVMLDEGVEAALITDFGLARTIDDATMTRSGAIAGTPEYMSPEQARGDALDCNSDVFSLGSLLYALSSGKKPFRAKTSFGVLRKITDEEPVPIRELNPDIPAWLCNLIAQMLAKNSKERPNSAQVHDLLDACLAHVYQPDQIPLPNELQNSANLSHAVFSKPVLIGAFMTMAIFLIASFVIWTQPDNAVSSDLAESKPLVAKSGKNPEVFRTLNLMFPKTNQRGTLEVDINRGFIELVGYDQPGVIVEILTPPKYMKSNEATSGLTRLFSPKYDVDTDIKKNLIKLDTYNQDYVLNLRIKVPTDTDISLDTYMDGYIDVKNINGTIKSRTQHSDIRLLNINGAATAYSRNGDLTVGFNQVAASAKLDFESYNGDINLTFPPSVAVTTAISSGRGEIQTNFKVESVEDNERPKSILAKIKSNLNEYRFGKINGGGIPLRIESEKGLIQFRKSVDANR